VPAIPSIWPFCSLFVEHYSLPTDHSLFFPQYGSLADIERHIGPEVAAVILEPMNFETFQPAPAGYLEGVEALCRRHGALLILDETRTALGRSGRLWMTSHYSAKPDILIMGKGLGAGLYPVSALATTRAVYDECMNSKRWGFMRSMAGSPVAALVARKTFELAQRPALVENVARLERALAGRFSDLCERYPDVFVPAWIKGGIAALGLRDSSAARIARGELFRRNVLCHSLSEIKPDVIKFLPCLTAGPDVVDEMSAALADFAIHQRRGVSVGV
jgi:acetylornithine aminotransferase